jgi:hypothetical protein
MFKAAFAILVCGCRSSLKCGKLAFHSRNIDDVFLPVLSLHHFGKAVAQYKRTEFTNCTSIISVVSICPNLVASCLFFVNLLAEGQHRVLLLKNFLCYQGIVKRIGICDNLLEARNPIPGSGP